MASIQYVVNATDAASGVFAKIAASADGLDKQLEDLSKRVATPEVDLKDAKFAQGMIRAAERLDKLSAQVADPKVEVDTRSAQVEILRINAMLDHLDAKRVTATVEVKTDRSFLSRLTGGGGGWLSGLLGGGGAAAGGVAAGAGGGGGDIMGILKGGGIAALIGAAAALGPALLPLGLGGLVGGGATLGAFDIGKTANKQMQALAKQLQSAQAAQAAAASPRTRRAAADRVAAAQGQMADLRKQSGPELAIFGAFKDVGATFKDVFAGALKAGGGPGGGPSFLTGLEGILKQVAGFIKSIGPQLGDMFRASLPFISTFVSFLEEAAKTLLPVFVQMLKQMAPFLPLISQGLSAALQGFADMLKAMGPRGMQAAALTFVGLMKAVGGILTVTGKAVNFFAIAVQDVAHWLQQHWKVVEWLAAPVVTAVVLIIRHWNDFRHETAVIFDGVRHDIAHIWDMIWNNTIGRIERGISDIHHEFDVWRHNIAVAFDTIRHDIATAWDTIWRNTVTRVQHGISDVIGWFKGLPGRAINALEGLGTSLYNFAHMAMSKLWSGLKTVFSDVWSWFKSLPGKLLNAIGIHSPPDWAIEAGKHIMGGILHGITSRKDELLSKFQAISAGMGSVAAMKAGPPGSVQALMQSMAAVRGWTGSQWQALYNVEMREAGFSLIARNPSSGAYGLAQFIQGPSEYYQYGGNPYTAAGQITGMLNYIRQRYGNPANAWAHELNFGWYDRGGWLPPGLTLALNQTGRPERVGGGGNVYNINITLPAGSDREQGRRIVEYIRKFEQGSGTGWRR